MSLKLFVFITLREASGQRKPGYRLRTNDPSQIFSLRAFWKSYLWSYNPAVVNECFSPTII
jgi:hypothetical protein